MSVDEDGNLTARPERHTVNTHDKPNRVSTIVVVSPDERFVFVGTTFDEPASANPDGSPILWVRRPGGSLRSIASNAPDPDGLAVFPVGENGTLGTPRFHDSHGGSPFYIAFLHGRPRSEAPRPHLEASEGGIENGVERGASGAARDPRAGPSQGIAIDGLDQSGRRGRDG